MKFISAALCFMLLGRYSSAEECPDSLPGAVGLTGVGLTLHYGIMGGYLCGKIESDTESWVGFGAQPAGDRSMIGAHSIIGLPLDNTVEQYMLNSRTVSGIVPFPADEQSLTETMIMQVNGTTVATFKQPLDDNGFVLSSDNVYLLAKGMSNELAYHGFNRGFVQLNFEENTIPTTGTSSTAAASSSTTTAATETPTSTTEAPPVKTDSPAPSPSSAALNKIGTVVIGVVTVAAAILN